MPSQTDYQNTLSSLVLNNDVLINKLNKALEKMKNEEHLLISTDKYKGYLYQDKENKCHYLALDNGQITTIYREDTVYDKPFQRLIDGNSDYLKYSSDLILAIFNSKKIEQMNKEKLNKKLNSYPESLKDLVRENLEKIMELPTQSVNVNPYEIKMFLTFLENNHLSSEFDKDFLYQNPTLFQKVQLRVPEFGIILEAIKNTLKKHNINSQNKFEYNDLDNHIWKNGDYILSTEQNFSWITDFCDAQNFTVYVALANHNGNGSKAKTASTLLKKIKSGEPMDDVDYVTLKVKNGKTVYANNAFMYSLDFNMMINKDALEKDNLLSISYGDIDPKSFEYQFAYVNQEYGYSKIDFLIHALFVLGNGYSYDEKSGRIYSDVKYLPDLLEHFEYKNDEKDQESLTSLVYLAPPKLKYLDDQWLKNLKLIVEKIKHDQPDLSTTHTCSKDTPEQVIKKLEKVITYNDNLRKNTPKP